MGSKQIALQTTQRVPVSPEIVNRLGSNVSAAYYYTQLLYYDRFDHKDDGWFDKNTREIEADIGLGRRQQEHSRKILESKGWIETHAIRGGLRPTTMFRVLVRFDSP